MLDAELGAAAGSHGGQVDVMAANVTCPRESFHSFSYSRVSRGLMVDVSWNGARSHLSVALTGVVSCAAYGSLLSHTST